MPYLIGAALAMTAAAGGGWIAEAQHAGCVRSPAVSLLVWAAIGLDVFVAALAVSHLA